MWVVIRDGDEVVTTFKSQVAAELKATELRRQGCDITVDFDEGGR